MSAAAPAIILVRPQLGENIGMAARAMANFGLSDLRLVAPRDGWGEGGPVWSAAIDAAVGAHRIVRAAPVFADVAAATADLRRLFATSARERDQAKPVLTAEACAGEAKQRLDAGQAVGILFGAERTGLTNEEIGLADAIVTFPVDPAFPSLNLAQSVSLVSYEWRKAAAGGATPFAMPEVSRPATRAQLLGFFEHLEAELDAGDYFIPDGKRAVMSRNLRNIFHRIELTEADIRTLRGVVVALAKGRKRRSGEASGAVPKDPFQRG
jgi:tRNA/rRNA methyltransferase